MKTSELLKLLKRGGCQFVEHGKKHDKWYSEKTGKFFMVPRHPSKDISPGTCTRILNDAGL